MRYVILGTAGHIDHGKSSLVKALTGIDPDRLKEEKERGITIDLGFADLKYPDSLTVGIIDVPGHERLVKNMLAGAGGIDIVLLVIAADEGIMPQSREHLAICNLLKIKSGIIAITKADLVEKEWLKLVTEDIKAFVKNTFLEGSDIISVSSKTGYNLDLLKEKIKISALKVQQKPINEIFRLPIDRVFTLKGFGTVVTGTVISGSVATENSVEILPSGITSRVRGLHSHGKPIQTAYAGQRVGINLQAVDKDSIRRGDTVVTSKSIASTRVMDVRMEMLNDVPPLKNKSNIHLHLSTSETIARVILYDTDELKPGSSCYCQLRLTDPVVTLSGDRFIARRISPVITIGGGLVLDPFPFRRRRKDSIEDLQIIDTGTIEDKIAVRVKKSGLHGIDISSLPGWLKAETPLIENSVRHLMEQHTVIQLENRLFHKDIYSFISDAVRNTLINFHKKNPLSPGMPKEELRTIVKLPSEIWNSLLISLNSIVSIDKDIIRLKSFMWASSETSQISDRILNFIEKARFQPPTKDELSKALSISFKEATDILKLMAKEEKLTRINDSIYVTSGVYNEILSLLKSFFLTKTSITVAEFRNILGTSRKYALLFLEYLDSNKITLRVGDVRKLLLK